MDERHKCGRNSGLAATRRPGTAKRLRRHRGLFASACAIAAEIMKLFSDRFLSFKFFLLAWFVIGISVDLLFGVWAREKLLSDFRRVAIERFGARSRVWFGGKEKQVLPPVISP